MTKDRGINILVNILFILLILMIGNSVWIMTMIIGYAIGITLALGKRLYRKLSNRS